MVGSLIMPQVINPHGLFDGDRVARLSREAFLHWSLFYVASNNYGRLEIDYHKLVAKIWHRRSDVPTQDEVAALIQEYVDAHLLFIYQTRGQLWGAWDTKITVKHYTQEDLRSPAPPEPTFTNWKEEYQATKVSASQGLSAFAKLVAGAHKPSASQSPGELPGNRRGIAGESPITVPQPIPLGVGVGEGVGVGNGVGEGIGDGERTYDVRDWSLSIGYIYTRFPGTDLAHKTIASALSSMPDIRDPELLLELKTLEFEGQKTAAYWVKKLPAHLQHRAADIRARRPKEFICKTCQDTRQVCKPELRGVPTSEWLLYAEKHGPDATYEPCPDCQAQSRASPFSPAEPAARIQPGAITQSPGLRVVGGNRA